MQPISKAKATLTIASTLVACAAVAATGLQTSSTCRIFSADEVRTATGAVAGSVAQTCRFDAATTSRICTIRTRLSNMTFDVALTDKYASVDDFIDEIKVNPPIARIQKQTRVYTSGSGTGGQIDYAYDGTRRQTKLTSSIGGSLLLTTYSAWDLKGRPTAATVSSQAPAFSLQYKFDDVLRTRTTIGPAGTQIETYDADGNMIKEEATSAMGRTNFAIKINKTDKVCK